MPNLTHRDLLPDSDNSRDLGSGAFRYRRGFFVNATFSNVVNVNGLQLNISSTTGNYTAATSDNVVLANGTFTVTLPSSANASGSLFYIKNIGSGTITLDGQGAETIDSQTSWNIDVNSTMAIVSNGTGWNIV